MTTTTLGARAQGTASLEVDAAAPAQRDLDAAEDERGGQERTAAARLPVPGGAESGPGGRRDGGSRRTGRGRPGRSPTRPCSIPNRACPPRRWLTRATPSPAASTPRTSVGRRQVHEVARQVEREPALAEDPRLEAVGVRHGDDQRVPPASSPRGVPDAAPASRRCSSECQKTTAAKRPVSSVTSASRTFARVEWRSSPTASRPRAASASSSDAVAGAHVEHRAGRRDASRRPASRAAQPPGARRAGPRSAPTRGGTSRRRRARARHRWRRPGGRAPQAGAGHAPQRVRSAGVERHVTPRAARLGGGRGGARTGLRGRRLPSSGRGGYHAAGCGTRRPRPGPEAWRLPGAIGAVGHDRDRDGLLAELVSRPRSGTFAARTAGAQVDVGRGAVPRDHGAAGGRLTTSGSVRARLDRRAAGAGGARPGRPATPSAPASTVAGLARGSGAVAISVGCRPASRTGPPPRRFNPAGTRT